MLSFFTLAATATTTAVPVAGGVQSADWTRLLIQLAVIIIIFYVLFMRPQQKRFKAQMQMLANLKVGDEVIVSGMIGKIAKIISDGEVAVEVADGVKIKVLRSSISQVVIENADAAPKTNNKK